MKNPIRRSLFFIFSIVAFMRADAQPFSLDDHIKPIELNFVNINPPNKPLAKGRMNVTNINQVEDTMYFFAKGFSTYAPIYLNVTALAKDKPLQVDLFKDNWLEANRSGNTGDKGFWEDHFKTEGDMGIRIIAKTKPAGYSIVVWNGADVDVDIPSPFTTDSATGDSGGFMGFLKKNYLYIIIGLLVLVIAFLFIRSRKKKA